MTSRAGAGREILNLQNFKICGMPSRNALSYHANGCETNISTSGHDLDSLQKSISDPLPLAVLFHQVPEKSGQKSFHNTADKPTQKT